MEPKVSILIPTYNRSHYLCEAIQSALTQTYSHIEVLVLDDQSPDDTPQVAAEFTTDPRVRYIRHENNLGIANNWKFGLQKATGDYFCLLHDDDTVEPNYIEALLQPLEKDGALILSFCDQWQMNAEGRRMPEGTEAMSRQFKRDTLSPGCLQNFAEAALMNVSIPIGAALFRRSMISPNFITEEAKGSIDIWLLYQCVKTAYNAYYVSERLMNYRVHDAGMSYSMPRYMLEGHLFRYRNILADSQMAHLHPAVLQQVAGTLTKLGITLLREGERCAARQSLRESFEYGRSPKNLVAYVLSCCGGLGTRAAMALRKY